MDLTLIWLNSEKINAIMATILVVTIVFYFLSINVFKWFGKDVHSSVLVLLISLNRRTP